MCHQSDTRFNYASYLVNRESSAFMTPYSIVKESGPRPYQIYAFNRLVGASKTEAKAKASVKHREAARVKALKRREEAKAEK